MGNGSLTPICSLSNCFLYQQVWFVSNRNRDSCYKIRHVRICNFTLSLKIWENNSILFKLFHLGTTYSPISERVLRGAEHQKMTMNLAEETHTTSRPISKNYRRILSKKFRMRLRRKNTKKFKHQLRKMFRHLRSQ